MSLLFYFDFISPYAYLGWKGVGQLAARNGRELEPRPVLFAALLNHYGHLGPAEIPPKRVYTFKHALRRAHDLNLPLAPPPTHPFRPLLALRVAALDLEPGDRDRAIDALFDATWAGGPGVEDPAVVTQVLDSAGLEGARLVSEASQPAAKERLKASTREAIERGVFGVPTMDADGELFWGADSFGDIDRFLTGQDPIDRALLSSWADVGASSVR